MMVKIDGALLGKIESGFGKSGKVKVDIFK